MINDLFEKKYCLCGCGRKSIPNKEYAWGHKPKPIPNHHPCACGCGELVDSDKVFVRFHHNKSIQNQPEVKERKSKMMTKKWQETEYREKQSSSSKIVQNDPEVKAKRAKTVADPDFKARQSEIQKEAQNRPEVKAKKSASLLKSGKDPEVKAKRSQSATECQNRPEVKAKQSKIQKQVQNQPDIRKRRIKAIKLALADPAVKAKQIGPNNGNWHGGSSFGEYESGFNSDLKRDIKERDGFHCRNCLTDKIRLDIHHIDFNKKNSSPDNLITLCRSCHAKTNGKNRSYWIDFYQAKMIPLSELDRFNQIEREALCA